MKRRQSLGLLAGAVAGTARSAVEESSVFEQAAALIQKPVTEGLLNAAVLQVQKGKETFLRSFGSATPNSQFLLGSITKPLTAIAAMVLVDRGRLNLTDPAQLHLPELKGDERQKITAQHLLTHTSGLPDQLPENNALRARHAPLSEFVAAAARTPLLFEPGTRYHYQSMGILLAAEIVQRVSGKPLAEFLEKMVFQPLALSHTVLGVGSLEPSSFVSMQTEHAAPESGAGDPNAKSWDWNSEYWRRLAAPWGGAHSTTADLTRLLRFFLHPDGKVFRAETARQMIQDYTSTLTAHRGIGWMLGDSLGRGCSPKTFGHSGSTGTLAWADPKTDISFVLLTSLPKNVSGDLIIRPCSDLISTGL